MAIAWFTACSGPYSSGRLEAWEGSSSTRLPTPANAYGRRMQKLTAELIIMFYALAVVVYALAVIGAGIYVYWATVVNASSGLEAVGLIALTLPTSAVYLYLAAHYADALNDASRAAGL